MNKEVFLAVVFLLRVAECSIQLQFQFHQYSNPSGLKYNQQCCDDIDGTSICISDCDTVFSRICLGPGGGTENCPWSDYVLTPGSVGEQNIQFTDSIGDIDNPFGFTVTSQMSAFQLYVEVNDQDSPFGNEFELIDEVKAQLPGTTGAVSSQTVTGTYGIVFLMLSYSLTCTQNYYGPNCSMYCVPSDNSMGHYNCSTSTGSKICLPGYQKPETDCTEVVCSLSCAGGGNCSESGVSCECSQGWSGPDCSRAQCAKNCHPVGGYCNEPGECHCNNNWNGSNCDQYLCHPNCSLVGGTCMIFGGCDCLLDLTRQDSETDLNPCVHFSPCENGGTCMNGVPNQHLCSCSPSFTAISCEEHVDRCNMSSYSSNATCIFCWQGGNCNDLIDGYNCSCPVEYKGHNCEMIAIACGPGPCQNGSSCTEFTTDYICDCLLKFTGKKCLIPTDALGFTPSPSTTSSNSTATPVIAGVVTAVLVVLIAVVVVLVLIAGAVLYTRKIKKQNYHLHHRLMSNINQCDSTVGELISVEQQPVKNSTDNHHQNPASGTMMTPNQAYNALFFGLNEHQPAEENANSWPQQQSLGNTKMTPNLAYGVHTFRLGDQQQPPLDDLSYEEVAVHSARNAVFFQPHRSRPAEHIDVSDAHIKFNPAYGVTYQQEQSSAPNKTVPKP